MIENITDIIGPVQKQGEKELTEKKHRNSASEIEAENFEMYVDHDDGFWYRKGKIALED